MTEIIFAVLFVSLMGLTRCYKTTVFLHLLTPHINVTVGWSTAATDLYAGKLRQIDSSPCPLVARALSAAVTPSFKELQGLCRSDGKYLDGLTLVPWQSGRSLVSEITVVRLICCLSCTRSQFSSWVGSIQKAHFSFVAAIQQHPTSRFVHPWGLPESMITPTILLY